MLGIIARLATVANLFVSDNHTVPEPRTRYERYLWEQVPEENRENILDM